MQVYSTTEKGGVCDVVTGIFRMTVWSLTEDDVARFFALASRQEER